jgi:hypothetical protein
MPRRDALDVKIFRRVAFIIKSVSAKEKTEGMLGRTCELQDLGCEVFKDGRGINRRFRADPKVVLRTLLQVPVNTANRKL